MPTKAATPSFLEYFADLPDPRIDRCKDHALIDIITIAILATICGAEHCTEMEAIIPGALHPLGSSGTDQDQ